MQRETEVKVEVEIRVVSLLTLPAVGESDSELSSPPQCQTMMDQETGKTGPSQIPANSGKRQRKVREATASKFILYFPDLQHRGPGSHDDAAPHDDP